MLRARFSDCFFRCRAGRSFQYGFVASLCLELLASFSGVNLSQALRRILRSARSRTREKREKVVTIIGRGDRVHRLHEGVGTEPNLCETTTSALDSETPTRSITLPRSRVLESVQAGTKAMMLRSSSLKVLSIVAYSLYIDESAWPLVLFGIKPIRSYPLARHAQLVVHFQGFYCSSRVLQRRGNTQINTLLYWPAYSTRLPKCRLDP